MKLPKHKKPNGEPYLDVPEELDLDAAKSALGGDAVYIERAALQRVAGERSEPMPPPT